MAVIQTNGVIQETVNVSNTHYQLSTATSGTWHELSTYYRASITPKLANSKIVLRAFLPVNQKGGINVIVNMTFQRSTDNGSTWSDISGIGAPGGSRRRSIVAIRPYGYDSNDGNNHVFVGYDTPSTTNTCIYRMVFQFNDGNANWFVNLSGDDGTSWHWTGAMTFTLTEIGA